MPSARPGEPGLLKRFGLFQSSHSDQAVEAYRDGLRRILLPRLILRLETVPVGEFGRSAGGLQPLKVYLMLGGQGPMDRRRGQVLGRGRLGGRAVPRGRPRLDARGARPAPRRRLLDDPDMAVAWPDRKPPLDGTAIASARAALQT